MTAESQKAMDELLAKGPWEETGQTAIAGGCLHWARAGKGPPLVLMPKVGGWLSDWRHVAAKLARHYTVIAIDPPGHGGSAMHGDPPFLISMEQSAAATMTALDMLGIDQFAAIGNSMGGMILGAAAMIFPQRISRLCMVSSSLIYPMTLDELRKAADARSGIYDSDFSYETVNAMFNLNRETYAEFVLSQAHAGLWKEPSIRGVGRSGPMQFLPRIKQPTMLIYGDRGTIYSKYASEAKRLRPDLQVAIVPDCGSFTHMDRPDETYDILKTFLDEQSQ